LRPDLTGFGRVFSASTRKRIVPKAAAFAQARDWGLEFKVVAADPEALWTALDSARRGRFGFWDALLLATAANHGCAVILSEDMHDGARFDGITVLNPFLGDQLPESVAALLR
jgi:predicted nucleic acid-binding protein